MEALTDIEHGKFRLIDKSKPVILDSRDAVMGVALGSICTGDLHCKHGVVHQVYGKNLALQNRRCRRLPFETLA